MTAGLAGATPGKRIVGLRVTDESGGGAIGYRRATVRRLVYVIGGWLLFVGWLWGLRDPQTQTWHDKAANTIVIQNRPPIWKRRWAKRRYSAAVRT